MKLVLSFVALTCLSVSSLLFANGLNGSELDPGTNALALPDLVVYRKNGLENVNYDVDNSISFNKLDVETVQKALDSGDGVTLNFDLEFAKMTAVMTAEGKHIVDILIGALKYMKSNISYEIQVYDNNIGPILTPDSLAYARAQLLISLLNKRYDTQNKFSLVEEVSKAKPRATPESSERVDIWSFSFTALRDHKQINIAEGN